MNKRIVSKERLINSLAEKHGVGNTFRFTDIQRMLCDFHGYDYDLMDTHFYNGVEQRLRHYRGYWCHLLSHGNGNYLFKPLSNGLTLKKIGWGKYVVEKQDLQSNSLSEKMVCKLTEAAKKIARFHLTQILDNAVGIHAAHDTTFEEWKSTLRQEMNQRLFENHLNIGVKLSNVCKTKLQLDFLAKTIDSIVGDKLKRMHAII